MTILPYHHVDVFSRTPLAGNGLAVVFPESPLPAKTLLAITREFNLFETIFLSPPDSRGAYPARIFTVDEELAFAGHPVLGAAATAHRLFHADDDAADIRFALGDRLVSVHSRREEGYCSTTMNQGRPSFSGTVDPSRAPDIAAALNLREDDLDERLPLEVVSTGLAYLLVPLKSGLADCKIIRPDFESFLAGFGAKFVYVFDAAALECRTWDNAGRAEDVATGSAAGPLCAYLVKNGLKKRGGEIRLSQGRFAGRPSVITGMVAEDGDVLVSGDVAMFASGEITMNLRA